MKLIPTVKTAAMALAGLMLLGSSLGLVSNQAQAYQFKTIAKTEHFALNQVILEQNDVLDAPTQSSITADIQSQNRLDKVYQSSTAIFPYESLGYTGKINTPILGLLTIANYDTGKDRIYFNRNVKYATDAGLYISFDQLKEMVNRKALNNLIGEFKSIPVVFTNIPVSSTGYDPTIQSFFFTSLSDAVIFDARVDDSVYFAKKDFSQKILPGCKVDVLAFVDRMAKNIPLFMSGRVAINNISCPPNVTDAAQANNAQESK